MSAGSNEYTHRMSRREEMFVGMCIFTRLQDCQHVKSLKSIVFARFHSKSGKKIVGMWARDLEGVEPKDGKRMGLRCPEDLPSRIQLNSAHIQETIHSSPLVPFPTEFWFCLPC